MPIHFEQFLNGNGSGYERSTRMEKQLVVGNKIQ